MKVLSIEPGQTPKKARINHSLKAMQAIVCGTIQAIYPFDDPEALICNNEGNLLELPPNRVLRHPETGEICDIIVGTFLLCAAPPDSENFQSLSNEQITRYTELFRFPEFFSGGTAT